MDWLIILLCGSFMLSAWLFQGACIIYAPIATFVAIGQARRHGPTSTWRVGLTGGLSAVFLLGLWIYFEAKMKGEPLSLKAVRTGYAWFYGFWAAVIFSNISLLIVFGRIARVGGIFDNLFILKPAIIPFLVGVPLWMISGHLLFKQLSGDEGLHHRDHTVFRSLIFGLPLVGASINLMVLPVMFLFWFT